MNFKKDNKRISNKRFEKILFVIVIGVCLALGCVGCGGTVKGKIVGKKVTKDKFKDFYYTYATTVNPPEFQRYRFYMENGKAFFYHEKREGNNVFLTEEDITVSGTKELSNEEWETFWNLIDGGSVSKRKENTDSGSSGPWLYLYWDGDKDVCQEFSFKEYGTVYEFEAFCEELVNSCSMDNEDIDTDLEKDIDIDSNIATDDVYDLFASIVTVNRFAMDELGRFDVGYRSIDYVEIDEDSAKLCPELAKSLNEFNDTRKQKFDEEDVSFSEAANKYAEHMFDVTHSEDSNMKVDEPEACVDYEFIDIYRSDSVAFSMLITCTDFWGTDALKKTYVGYTYHSKTGKRLDIEDIITDWTAYKDAVLKEFERKYEKVEMEEIDPTDYLGWTLTPEGIIIYYPEDYVKTPDYKDQSVQINFDEYPGIFNEKYCMTTDEYVIPFDGDDIFYMDVEGDKIREAVVYSPLHSEEYTVGAEYPSYEIYINGKCYSNFDEDWFYAFKPYYVHKKDGNYIYTYTEGYGHDFITVNKFEGDKPICIAKLQTTPFYAENIDDKNEEFINRHIAFTNPSIVHDALSFDKNVCGIYRSDEENELEASIWDICNIDGRYYIDYIGEYDYAAAEIELLDENPYLCGDELRYMVRVYPYSGFSFGGEYQGAGQVMYISSKVGVAEKQIALSSSNPFCYSLKTMNAVDGVSMHEIQDKCETNKTAPEIVGSWRCIIKNGSEEYDVYLQFSDDGRVDIVRKKECFTPMVYRGIYNLEKKDDKFVGKIEAEAIGMGRQPMADWTLEFDPASDSPINIVGEYDDENPFVYDANDMMFTKVESGKHDKYIHPGPYKRVDEVTKMWDEYLYSDDDHFDSKLQSEYMESIVDGAVKLASGTSNRTYGIQDNKNGGEIWIQIFEDVLPSVQVTKNWVRYDLGKSEYYDICDNLLEEE